MKMNRTYIESYYERYKDADFVADFIKEEMKLGYEWLKSRPDREKIVEEIIKCRVKFVKYLKIMNLNERNRPKIRAWQWIMIEYKAIENYISNGNCVFSCFETKNEPEIPVFEVFKDENQYRELYLNSALTSYQRFEPNAIVTFTE
jgi:hypothetical protein